jgi:shikimate kinase
MECVLSSGILVYLSVAPDEIVRRVHRKTDRPLLTDIEGNRISEEEVRARVVRLFEQRRPFYEMADLIISADDSRVGVTVDQIVKSLLPVLR